MSQFTVTFKLSESGFQVLAFTHLMYILDIWLLQEYVSRNEFTTKILLSTTGSLCIFYCIVYVHCTHVTVEHNTVLCFCYLVLADVNGIDKENKNNLSDSAAPHILQKYSTDESSQLDRVTLH